MRKLFTIITILFCFLTSLASAQDTNLVGPWLINEDLSDDSDDKVELAIIAAGGEATKGFFNRDREDYRGGPVEQEPESQ